MGLNGKTWNTYMMTVAQLHQQIKCKFMTNEAFSREFMSTIGMQQGSPRSPTLFGLSINQLPEFIQETIGEHNTTPTMGHFTQLLLIYVNNIVSLAL